MLNHNSFFITFGAGVQLINFCVIIELVFTVILTPLTVKSTWYLMLYILRQSSFKTYIEPLGENEIQNISFFKSHY